MAKLRIAVLRGGPGDEHAVSLKTGKSVLSSLENVCQLSDIRVDKSGTWYCNGLAADPQQLALHHDAFFNALHGEYGEDGKVQQILESLGVPYTGPGVMPAALSMNKRTAKDIYRNAGIKTPQSTTVYSMESIPRIAARLFSTFPMPLIMKPVASGSSVGIHVARTAQDIAEGLEYAFTISPEVLIEEYIEGKEVTCGVIDGFRGADVYVCPPVEIAVAGPFDYEAKYHGDVIKHCPARLTKAEKELVEVYAREAHESLGLRHYSRSDFIVHPRRGVYILETNSLPGLTQHSLLPLSLEAVGVGLPEFLEHVVGLAVKRK